MKSLQHELMDEVKSIMLTPEGKDDLKAEKVVEDVANVIVATIVGGPYAVLDEWGSGSWMDRSNPALKDYRNSDMWNPARGDTKIRSRPDKPGQKDIFGNPVNGKGEGGVDLEALGVFEAQAPSHAIRTAARWMADGRMQFEIKKAVQRVPFHRFIITDKK